MLTTAKNYEITHADTAHFKGTCKVRNEIETKRNRTKRKKPIETKRNGFVSFCLISFRFVRFRFVSISFRTLQVPCLQCMKARFQVFVTFNISRKFNS